MWGVVAIDIGVLLGSRAMYLERKITVLREVGGVEYDNKRPCGLM